MPSYFFDVRDSGGDAFDPEGVELRDVEAARVEALKGARSLIADGVLRGLLDLTGSINVKDEAGRHLFALRYADAVATV